MDELEIKRAASRAHPYFLRREDAVFVFVDVQERFAPSIHGMQALVESTTTLARAADVLELPVLVTEQYPRGLGRTLPGIVAALPRHRPIEKTVFSCCAVPEFLEGLEAVERPSVVVCGIEAHVCVLQTVLGLRQLGYRVWLAADAVGSRAPADRELALMQMDNAGAVISSVETVLFQLLEDARAPHFRAVQDLIK